MIGKLRTWPTVIGVTLLGLLAIFGPAACSRSEAKSGKPTAVTAIFSYYDALRAIGGDDINSVILLPAGSSTHEYQPTVKDKATVAGAGLIVENGLNLDKWLIAMADDNKGAAVVNVADVIKGKKGMEVVHAQEVSVTDAKDKKPGEEEDMSAGNPHIWLDPQVQMMAAQAIRDALIKLDPAHADGYRQRAQTYLGEITDLDKKFAEAAAKFKQKDFIGFHSAYAYLARRYGLNQVAAVEELPGEGPTISQTANIIKLIKEKNIKVIFMENAFPAKAADTILRETGVSTGVLQPLETYDDVKQTYVGLMTQNLEALKKALN
jgi:zinc transport system substrate-binding protein